MFLTEYNIILHPLCPSLHDNYCCMMHKEKASELFESNYGFRNQWGYFLWTLHTWSLFSFQAVEFITMNT